MRHKRNISVSRKGGDDRYIKNEFPFLLLISFCFFPKASNFMLMIAESILEVHHRQASICQESVFITNIVACALGANLKAISCIYMCTKKMKCSISRHIYQVKRHRLADRIIVKSPM